MNLKRHCRRSNVGCGVVSDDFLVVGNHADWSNIHPDLLEYIQKKLPLPDIFRCRYVCRHWRSTAKALILSSPSTSLPRTPMLMLNHKFFNLFRDEDYSWGADDGHLFLNLAAAAPRKSTTVNRSKPVLKHGPIGRFSGGWLVGVERNQHGDQGRICMFNPSSYGTSTFLRLPRILHPYRGSVQKVVFWGNPILGGGGGGGINNNYGMVIISGGYLRRLYYAKAGDTKFSELEGQVIHRGGSVDHYRLIHDIICIKDTVYGVTLSGYIEAWDCSSCSTSSQPKKILSFQPDLPQRDCSRGAHSAYLVEYQGEMLFVSQCHIDQRRMFGVYKLDLDLKRWVALESLGDMALILLRGNQTIALSTKEFPNYERNSIYFVYLRYISIFNLEDGSWQTDP